MHALHRDGPKLPHIKSVYFNYKGAMYYPEKYFL